MTKVKYRKVVEGDKPKGGGFQDKRCYNCNHRVHLASDRQCPTHGKTCRKCEDTGHYKVRCTKKVKGQAQSKRAYNIEDSSGNSEPKNDSMCFM